MSEIKDKKPLLNSIKTRRIGQYSAYILIFAVMSVCLTLFFLYIQNIQNELKRVSLSLPEISAKSSSEIEKIENLEQEISILKETVSEIQKKLDHSEISILQLKNNIDSQNTVTPVKIDELKSRVSGVEARFSNLEAKLSSGAQGHYEKQFTSLNALWTLQFQINNGMPFKSEFRAISQLTKEFQDIRSELDKIAPYSEDGIKTMDELKYSFRELVKQVIHLTNSKKENEGFISKTLSNISKVITIRKIDSMGGEDPESIINRAEKYLHDGDLSLAIEEIQKLPEEYHEITKDWLINAEARMTSLIVIGNIYNALIDYTGFSEK